MNNRLLAAVAGLFLSVCAGAQNFSLGVNVFDCADLGTMNLEASCGIARRWTVSAGLKYNPFTWEFDGRPVTDRQRSLEAGARFWPWHIYSGWWMVANLNTRNTIPEALPGLPQRRETATAEASPRGIPSCWALT